MAAEEPVTSPDQHRPTISKRLARLGAVVTIVALLLMVAGNHEGNVENIFLIATAALIFVILVADVVLRRSGLKSD